MARAKALGQDPAWHLGCRVGEQQGGPCGWSRASPGQRRQAGQGLWGGVCPGSGRNYKWESLWVGGTRSDCLEDLLGLLKQGCGLGGCQGELVVGQPQVSQ